MSAQPLTQLMGLAKLKEMLQPMNVIPAQAGIQCDADRLVSRRLDSRLRRNDELFDVRHSPVNRVVPEQMRFLATLEITTCAFCFDGRTRFLPARKCRS